jgi:hypothetical protein
MPYRLYLCLSHFIPSPPMSMQHMHQHDQQLIWSTSYHYVTLLVYRSWPHLLFTVVFIHRPQVLLKLHRHAVHWFKASNLPFTLATGPSSRASSWSSPPSHMTPCHVSYAMSFFIICVSLAIFSSHLYFHGIGCSHMMYLWTNYLCISHKHLLVHLGYHSITKTKLGMFHQYKVPLPHIRRLIADAGAGWKSYVWCW